MPIDTTFRLATGSGQNVSSVAGTSTPTTNSFGPNTLYVRVVATAACNIRIDAGTPVALATDTLLSPNYPEYFTCGAGQKLAAIGGPATVNVTELS